jgi:glycosyltransferase involved in cell wall biosynthesis
LRGDGHEVTFLPINPEPPARLRWMKPHAGLRTIATEAAYLPSLTKLAHVDAVHVFSAAYWSFLLAPAPALLAARGLRRRVVLNYHSGEAPDHLGTWGWRVHPWLMLADEIVVTSRYLSEVFAAHGHPTRVIAGIVDTSQFIYRERETGARFLSVRNLMRMYGIDTIVRAFARIRASRPDATLTIAGTGPEEPALRTLVESLGLTPAVRFLGWVAAGDMPRVCAEADVMLNASVIDNQPGSILEAFSAGLPVVTTATGGIGELVRNGQTGVIVPANDPDAMATAALRLLGDPAGRRALTRAARDRIRDFTWAAVRDAWMDAYGSSTLAASAHVPGFSRTA